MGCVGDKETETDEKNSDKKNDDTVRENENKNKSASDSEVSSQSPDAKNKDKAEKKKLLNLNSKKEQNKKNSNKNNLETESKTTENIQKIVKSDYNGVTVLENINECFPDDVSENAVHNIVIDALDENIENDKKNDKKKNKKEKKISQEQADAIADIVYKKVKKGNTGKKNNYEKVDLKEYPMLKDVNLKIGLNELTKDVVKDVLYDGKKVDDKEVEETLQNLIKNNGGCKALMIEFDN